MLGIPRKLSIILYACVQVCLLIRQLRASQLSTVETFEISNMNALSPVCARRSVTPRDHATSHSHQTKTHAFDILETCTDSARGLNLGCWNDDQCFFLSFSFLFLCLRSLFCEACLTSVLTSMSASFKCRPHFL